MSLFDWHVDFVDVTTFILILCVARVVRNVRQAGNADKIIVCVGTITNDLRIFEVPKMTVCALRVTEKARDRILKVTIIEN